MSVNQSSSKLENQLITTIKELQKKFEQLRTNQLNSLIIPVVTTDPSGLVNGQMWYNSTSNTFKCYQNGLVKTFTVS